ncbi:MAG: hypothetical protein HY424_00865 [Candidatus Levybacteria bacterium]|nr:hypothetical protein [Candidatus Levybacteria bacterium]
MDDNSSFKSLLSFKTLLATIIILLILNLIYLDISFFKNAKSEKQKEAAIAPLLTPRSFSNQVCPTSCLAQIYQATSSSKTQTTAVITTPTQVPAEIPPEVPTPTTTPIQSPQIKEFFIPFGSGTNSSDDWEDVAGLKASINSANYPSIKSAVFEASVNIPTGNQVAYVRLFNETDKHPVWNSDVSVEGGTAQLLISKPITLDSGTKTYKVQMKTSLKYQAVLAQARIHIITN